MSALILLLLFTTTTSANVFTAEQTAEIEDYVNAVVTCKSTIGLTVTVVKNNDTWTRGFGLADREKNISVNANTLFGIGSLTKAFTSALLAMSLNDSEGKYNYTSKLTDILGDDFKMADPEMTREATLRDILAHRAGLNPATIGLFSGQLENVTRRDFVRRLRFLRKISDFRDRFVYNNWMYLLVGHVIEVLSKESWEKTLYKRLLKPLGMTTTRILGYDLKTTSGNVAQPYAVVENKIVKTSSEIYSISPDEPAGAIASTANDMAKWLHFLISAGETTTGTRLLDKHFFVDMMGTYNHIKHSLNSIFKPTFPVTDAVSGYGYDWIRGTYRGYQKIWHHGSLFSYRSIVVLYPDLKSGIFLSASGPVALEVMTYFISDLLIGEPTWLQATNACLFPEPWMNISTSNDNSDDVIYDAITNPSQYIGSYGHRLLGDLTVEQGSNRSSLLLRYGRFVCAMRPTKTEHAFKLDVLEPLRFLLHPHNSTSLIPANFKEEWNGKFQVIEIVSSESIIFHRDIKFSDPLPPEKNEAKCTSSGTSETSSGLIILISCYITHLFFKLD